MLAGDDIGHFNICVQSWEALPRMAAITSQDWSMAFPGLRVAPDVTLPISGRDLEEMLGATNEGWGIYFSYY
jgi:hypothetical protein